MIPGYSNIVPVINIMLVISSRNQSLLGSQRLLSQRCICVGGLCQLVCFKSILVSTCVSKGLAESCSDLVTTILMQDDIVPGLSAASLARLTNEILQTDWMRVVEKADWKSVVDLVTNAKLVVSSVQDVARKLADYAKFKSKRESSDFGGDIPVNIFHRIVLSGNLISDHKCDGHY